MINLQMHFFPVKLSQFNAALANTGAIRGLYYGKLYQALELEYLHHRL